jgi:hypothetical protein
VLIAAEVELGPFSWTPPRLETELSGMPTFSLPQPTEFRQPMAGLVRSGGTPEAPSRKFEPTAQSIWNWVRQAERDGGTGKD